MKLTRSMQQAGLCLAFILPATALAQTVGKTPASKPQASTARAKKAAVPKKPQTSPAGNQAPASAGMVVVKDWESGGGTRAPQAGDFPVAPQPLNLLRVDSGRVIPTADGGIELVGDETLRTTMTVSKTATGDVYSCSQGGDHSKHNHPVASQVPQQPEVK